MAEGVAGGRGSRPGRLNGCHVLRHTAASAWLSAGLNPAKVAAYLGDTLQVVVNIYAHFLPEDDERARAVMGPSSAGEQERRLIASQAQDDVG